MFLDNIELIKDRDILEELENKETCQLIQLKIDQIFRNWPEYKQKEIDETTDTLINYITFVLIAYSNYSYQYVNKVIKLELSESLNHKKGLDGETLDIWDFIEVAAHSNDNDLDLCRINVDNSKVLLNTYQTQLYLKYKMRKKLTDGMEKIKERKLPDCLKQFVDEINSFLDVREMLSVKKDKIVIKPVNYSGEIPAEWFPPCIRGILADISSGGSPTHYPRRSLVAFLFAAKFNHNLRMYMDGRVKEVKALDLASTQEIELFLDEIISIFNTSADFNAERTKYYISNNIGYNSPRYVHCEYCKNWKDNGLGYYCHKDEICEKPWVKHPLDYLCQKIKAAQWEETLTSDCKYLDRNLDVCNHIFNRGYGCFGDNCRNYTPIK
ncbi:hypothetical protein [Methanococcus sp. CF]